jgi:peroxiredoxin
MRISHLLTVAGLAAALTLSGADFPRPASAITFKTPAGGAINLKQYRGKVVALEFLLTGCHHCQLCSGIMQKLQTEYGAKGFQAVGAATNDIALVPRFVLDLKLQYPVGFATGEQARTFLQHPAGEILQFPQTVLIDRAGMIRWQHTGCREDDEKEFRTRIEELLKVKQAGTASRKVK